jgi:hypothetical protein
VKAGDVVVGETYTVLGWKPKGYSVVDPWTARVEYPARVTADAFVVRRLDDDGPGFTTPIPAALLQPCRAQLDLFGLPVELTRRATSPKLSGGDVR